MPETKTISPALGPVAGSIQPPGSKSITNRALICAALADGTSNLTGVLDSDDTQVMLDSLNRLGFGVTHDPVAGTVQISGADGSVPNRSAELFVGNSGTSVRFLTATLGMAGGEYVLDGVQRMRERPIGPLVEALQNWGSDVQAVSANQCPPVKIGAATGQGNAIQVKGNISSQYLSGLLMAAPQLDHDVRIEIVGKLVSVPYINMTLAVMRSFGVDVATEGDDDQPTAFSIAGGEKYSATDYRIEPDASAASYFFAIPAIVGGSATVKGLDQNSLQGDVGFVRCLEKMGCDVKIGDNQITVSGTAIRGIDIDMKDISDTVQTLAAVAVFVDGPSRVRNVAHNRVKETDRIGNLAIELRKLGIRVDEHQDGLTIHPGPLSAATFATYDDHRMAMSLALIGLRQEGVQIEDPGCVSKTYPGFFRDLERFVRS